MDTRKQKDKEKYGSIPDPSDQRLHWTKPPLSVLIIRKHLDNSVLLPFRDLVIWLVEEYISLSIPHYTSAIISNYPNVYSVCPLLGAYPIRVTSGCTGPNPRSPSIPDPSDQRLHWTKPPLSVLIIRKHLDNSVLLPFRDLVIWLVEEKSMLVYVEQKALAETRLPDDKDFAKVQHKLRPFKQGVDDLTDKVDFIICLGGDGTLLYVSSLFQVPYSLFQVPYVTVC
ncbi:hypothetical protein EGW08_013218 [Elysia chlorotica]|uniref:NAD(+) kinase n=1 Tax=Elysia chlorotica TaxID=188477 RepID=A0A3S1B9H1_ELYCH|nr:hypothetical protein EGW08_013218 [Elysia chlorotica]